MKVWRVIFLPFSFVYAGIAGLRNWFYTLGIFKSFRIPLPSICIGNLRVGGTGKTPMTLYLAALLEPHFNLAIISRGYGRKTRGYRHVLPEDTAELSGDEPLLFRQQLSAKSTVIVSEKRKEGFQQVQQDIPNLDVVLFDDAFQHRRIQAGLSLLLTEFDRPFWKDTVLPFGRLREPVSGKKRADLLVITKSPQLLSPEDKKECIQASGFSEDNIYFSTIIYKGLVPKTKALESFKQVILVTGIDNPTPLRQELEAHYSVKALSYADHYPFNSEDLQDIHDIFDTFAQGETAIVTTTKDYVRLVQADQSSKMNDYPWFVMEIGIEIDRKETFNQRIIDYVRSI